MVPDVSATFTATDNFMILFRHCSLFTVPFSSTFSLIEGVYWCDFLSEWNGPVLLKEFSVLRVRSGDLVSQVSIL